MKIAIEKKNDQSYHLTELEPPRNIDMLIVYAPWTDHLGHSMSSNRYCFTDHIALKPFS